jgi:hypothetical protein
MARGEADGSKTYLVIQSYGNGTINGGRGDDLKSCIIENKYILAEINVGINDIKKILPEATSKDTAIKTGTVVTVGTESYTVVQVGNVDGKDTIKSADYIIIKNYIMSKRKLNAVETKAADANRDGKVSSADYIAIKNHIMEKKYITID